MAAPAAAAALATDAAPAAAAAPTYTFPPLPSSFSSPLPPFSSPPSSVHPRLLSSSVDQQHGAWWATAPVPRLEGPRFP